MIGEEGEERWEMFKILFGNSDISTSNSKVSDGRRKFVNGCTDSGLTCHQVGEGLRKVVKAPTKIRSKSEVLQERWQMVNRVVKLATKGKMQERGRKVVNGLAEEF